MSNIEKTSAYFESIGVMFEDAKDRKSLQEMIESKSFQNAFKQYLPKTFAKYGAVRNTPLAVRRISNNAKINKKLTSYIKSNIDSKSKNLKVTVYQIPEKLPNMFTIPGIHLGMSRSELSLSSLIFGSFKLKKYDFKVEPSGKKILLNSNIKVEPMIIMTQGMADDEQYTNDEKMAMVLHELGHWSAAASAYQKTELVSIIVETLLRLSLVEVGILLGVGAKIPFKYIVALLVVVIAIAYINGILSRSAEFEADAFVKKAGRGRDLSDALQKMSGNDPVATKAELDEYASFLEKISAFTDFLSISSHPSTHRRSGRLLESERIEEDNISDNISNKTIITIASKLDNMISSKPIVPLLWAFTGK